MQVQMTFDWVRIGPEEPHDIWHMVKLHSTTTLCGLDVPNPDEEWRFSATLGSHRPCDNCTRILAQTVNA